MDPRSVCIKYEDLNILILDNLNSAAIIWRYKISHDEIMTHICVDKQYCQLFVLSIGKICHYKADINSIFFLVCVKVVHSPHYNVTSYMCAVSLKYCLFSRIQTHKV